MKYVILLIGLVFFGCSETPIETPIGSQDNVEVIVTFSVDMSFQIDEGNFNPNIDELFIAGNFNGWCQDSCDEIIRITDDQYDIVFTNSDNSFFQVDTELQFKFKINEDDWETPNPAVSNCIANEYGGYNRLYVLESGSNSLPKYWYNDESEN